MQRRPLIMGNWKMNLSRAAAASLARGLKRELAGQVVACEVAVCPSHIHLAEVSEILAGSTIGVGAQDCAAQRPGAVTGATSADQVRELGLRWVILGHSERRAIFGESDALLASKLRTAFDSGLEVVLCVGETETQRDAGQTRAVVLAQLEGALSGVGEAARKGLTLAYEPVWAIGTGRNAVPADVAEVHASLRSAAAGLLGDDVAAALRILYGGSVKPSNIADYIEVEDVDGALVGGASLAVESFLGILRGV
jgi:triosephosphate isomerase (TIM)